MPASMVGLYSPAASVTIGDLPVTGLASLSVESVAGGMASGVVNTVPAGLLNCTWYCTLGVRPVNS